MNLLRRLLGSRSKRATMITGPAASQLGKKLPPCLLLFDARQLGCHRIVFYMFKRTFAYDDTEQVLENRVFFNTFQCHQAKEILLMAQSHRVLNDKNTKGLVPEREKSESTATTARQKFIKSGGVNRGNIDPVCYFILVERVPRIGVGRKEPVTGNLAAHEEWDILVSTSSTAMFRALTRLDRRRLAKLYGAIHRWTPAFILETLLKLFMGYKFRIKQKGIPMDGARMEEEVEMGRAWRGRTIVSHPSHDQRERKERKVKPNVTIFDPYC